jgi:O-antigen/teichoic acid export membrane protein
MADQSVAVSRMLLSNPSELRTRIFVGMRWTVWLSILALPFSFGTNVVLARIGPEAIGTFGLLAVYISIVAAFLYLGGDSVIIKFIPELSPDKRLPFLLSYLLIVGAALCLWLALFFKWPEQLGYLFGNKGNSSSFYLLVLYLSPLYIVFSMIVAVLKGLLEIRSAQTLTRGINIGSFCIYAVLSLFAHQSLALHYTTWVWTIYLGLTALLGAVGLQRLFSVSSFDWRTSRWQFFLPSGFWKYLFATQQLSILGFFVGRLDYVLVLRLGNLKTLGQYAAISTIALLIPQVNMYFLDSLLPSLTNLFASSDLHAASEIFRVYMRISFIVNTATTCALLLLTSVVLKILGPQYTSLHVPLIIAILLIGLANPGAVGNILLSSVGKQQRAVYIAIAQFALYCVLFSLLWPLWHLLGAIVAYGSAICVSYLASLFVAGRCVPIKVSVAKEYGVFTVVSILTAAAVLFPKSSLNLLAAPLWVFAMALFLLLAGYRGAEIRILIRCFLPDLRTHHA